jgi:DNA-directed RNA polymerase subunit RPC12/RpoP
MFVNSLDFDRDRKLSQILHTLKHVHQWELASDDEISLLETQSVYEALKQKIVEQSAFNSYYNNPEYTKAALITEAVYMLLEIAPKRRKKSVKEGEEQYRNKDHYMRKGNLKEKMATRDWDGDGKIESEKDEVWGSRMRAADKAKQKKKKLKEDQNLEQAETLLAAKDISDQLQDMAEDAAKMSVDALMPLVDTMKAQFGQEQANAFNEVLKTNLQSVLDAVIKAKDETDNAIMALQGGQTPAASADISAPVPSDPSQEQGAEIDLDQEFSASPATSGPVEEPLGRASKRELDEARKKCMECGTGVYETHKPGHMVCNNCGSKMVAEAWDTKMKTAKKDIGKWEGYSISELKARKKKLMVKEERSAKEQKEVHQINFALRAKQENNWGKIKEADEGSVAELATMAITGKKKNGQMLTPTQKKAAQDAAEKLSNAKIDEKITKKMSQGEIISDFVHSDDPKFKGKNKAERTKMALGAYYGMHPENSKKEESQLAQVNALLESLIKKFNQLKTQLAEHKTQFAKKLNEGRITDPLNLGYGLEGDAIRLQMRSIKEKVQEAQTIQGKVQKLISNRKTAVAEAQTKLQSLDKNLGSTPYGVIGIQTNGQKVHRLFESAEKRLMWLEFQQDTLKEYRLIDPSNIDKAKQYLKKRIER